MKSVLSVDVANGKSEVLLITEYGEILIEPYEVKHCLSEFNYIYYLKYLLSSIEKYFNLYLLKSSYILLTIISQYKNSIFKY